MHFYYGDRKCADSQFYYTDNAGQQSKDLFKCEVERGGAHDHPKVPLSSIEFHLFRWGCVLRVLSTNESLAQSVDFVVANWPRKPLPFLMPTGQSSFFRNLKKYQNGAESQKPLFSSGFGQKQFGIFLQFLQPLMVSSGKGHTILLCLELMIIKCHLFWQIKTKRREIPTNQNGVDLKNL